MRIVFFGTSSFAARILIKLIADKTEISAVVTRQDKPSGRHLHTHFSPVKETLLQIAPSTPLFQPEKASAPEFALELEGLKADLFVVVAYGEILRENILKLPTLGCINVHPSLLPKYRGAAPIQRTLMQGDPKTGVCIIEMSKEMDAGAILAKEEIDLPPDMCFGELEPILCDLGAKLVLNVVHQYEEGRVVKAPQDHTQATFAPKITPLDERIDWSRPALSIHNQIRALSPSPGAWTDIQIGGTVKRLKIKKSLPLSADPSPAKTFLQFNKEGWIISCGEGALRLLEIQLEGKRAMSVADFMQGLRHSVEIQ